MYLLLKLARVTLVSSLPSTFDFNFVLPSTIFYLIFHLPSISLYLLSAFVFGAFFLFCLQFNLKKKAPKLYTTISNQLGALDLYVVVLTFRFNIKYTNKVGINH